MIQQIHNLNQIEDTKNEGDVCSEGGYIATQIVRVNTNKIHSKLELNTQYNQKVKQASNSHSQEKLSSRVEIPNELPQNDKEMNECEVYQKQHEALVFVNEFNKFNSSQCQQVETHEQKQNNENQQNNQNDNINQHHPEIQHNHLHLDKAEDDENSCRICLDSESSPETGDILNICECKGSLKYIHKVCLWMQLSSKVKLDEFEKNNQQFKCELCKTQYRIQVGVTYTLQKFQKFKARLIDQLRPIIIFLFLTVISTVFSFLLVDYINNEGINKKKSAIGFMYYMFASFVITTAFISVIVLLFIVCKAAILKKVCLKQVFNNKEDFENFQQRTRSRSRASTSASVQAQELIVAQNTFSQGNENNA